MEELEGVEVVSMRLYILNSLVRTFAFDIGIKQDNVKQNLLKHICV